MQTVNSFFTDLVKSSIFHIQDLQNGAVRLLMCFTCFMCEIHILAQRPLSEQGLDYLSKLFFTPSSLRSQTLNLITVPC